MILELVKSRTKSARGLRSAIAIGSFSMLLAACANDKPLNTFEPRGPIADGIDSLIQPIFWIAGIIGVLVVGGAIFMAVKNRVKPDDYDPLDFPAQTHGHFAAEITWTVLPGIVLAVIAVFTVWGPSGIWKLEEENKPGELDVMVIGQQWWWEYRYDVDGDGFFEDVDGNGVTYQTDREGRTDANHDAGDAEWPLEIALDDDDISIANELVIPVGQTVDLTITSRDVIHSFWIPRLNGKRDAVPGRLHTWKLEADEPGEYTGWCTEFCGLSHARMRMSTIALPQDQFDEWLANQATVADVPVAESEAGQGQELFAANCASCHVIYDEGGWGDDADYPRDFEAALVAKVAPNLTHFATRSVMAGGIFSTYVGLDAADDELSQDDGDGLNADEIFLNLPSLIPTDDDGPDTIRWNRAQLKRWIKNAPAQKDMAPDEQRGMPAFPALSDEDIDHLIAYLATLD